MKNFVVILAALGGFCAAAVLSQAAFWLGWLLVDQFTLGKPFPLLFWTTVLSVPAAKWAAIAAENLLIRSNREK